VLTADPFFLVLGTAQDGGYPQAGCRRPCCEAVWRDGALRRHAACVAVVNPGSGARWLVDTTPDFREQLRRLDDLAPVDAPPPGLDGIVLTHGHVGHYAGLLHLGREVLGAREVPVWCAPRLAGFLRSNGPWNELVRLGHVELRLLEPGVPLLVASGVAISPFLVPHRAEVSETVGLRVEGPRGAVLYVPDTDGWDAWEPPIETFLASVDRAYLDGTFFDAGELEGRAMADVPHPTIAETMRRLASLPAAARAKVRFTHLNHTNPAIGATDPARGAVMDAGFGVAEEGEIVAL